MHQQLTDRARFDIIEDTCFPLKVRVTSIHIKEFIEGNLLMRTKRQTKE